MTGLAFEERIKVSCEVYRKRGMALIHKIPTPWSVSYDKAYKKVLSAYPQDKSSVDFEGIWQGKSIAFEAKSTTQSKRFDLRKVQDHQMEYLTIHQQQGGISFFLVEFSKLGEVYFISYKNMKSWMKASENGGRKSIPYNWIQTNCEIIMPGRVTLDFLKVLERLKNADLSQRDSNIQAKGVAN